MSAVVVEIYKTGPTGADGPIHSPAPLVEWRWRFKAANGEIIASGEAYTRASDAKRAVLRLLALAQGDVDIRTED